MKLTKERPIIFNTEMVKAILDGRKTQTRRVIKIPEYGRIKLGTLINDDSSVSICYDLSGCADWKSLKCPYGKIGDRLWVRETWAVMGDNIIRYKADGKDYFFNAMPKKIENTLYKHGSNWRPSIFMPYLASRINLEIIDIRVERMQDISWDDLVAEGYPMENCINRPSIKYATMSALLEWFIPLWNSINAKRGYGWVNSWVWAVTFKVLKKEV